MVNFIDRKDARRMDLFTQFAMVCADEALADSKLLDNNELDLDRIGVIWGSGIGGLRSLEAEIIEFALGNGTPRFNQFMIPRIVSDIAPGCTHYQTRFQRDQLLYCFSLAVFHTCNDERF